MLSTDFTDFTDFLLRGSWAMGLLPFQGFDICWMGWTRWTGRTGENVSLASERAEDGFAQTGSGRGRTDSR